MTPEQKINYLRIALQLQDIGCTKAMSDTIVTTYERLMKRKGEFSISDAVDIKFEIRAKYQNPELFEDVERIESEHV